MPQRIQRPHAPFRFGLIGRVDQLSIGLISFFWIIHSSALLVNASDAVSDVLHSDSQVSASSEIDPEKHPNLLSPTPVRPTSLVPTLGASLGTVPEGLSEQPEFSAEPLPPLEPEHAEGVQNEEGQAKHHEELASTQMLFEQVFGKPVSGSLRSVVVPWSINQKPQGDMGIRIGSEPNDIRWNTTSFLEQLGEALQPKLYEQLSLIEDSGSFSIAALKTLNIEAYFDPQQLTLDIVLTPEQLRTNVIAGKASATKQKGEPSVASAAVSGYVNMRGNLGWDWVSEQEETGRQPLDLSWDGALNLSGWVLEGRADFAEAGTQRWRRGDLRLVRDWADVAVRSQAGEISPPTTGYQRGQAILGVAASRQFSIQPDRVTRPVSRYEFFLESPSEVEVYINGIKDQTLDLPAGTQDLRDLSLGAGVNDIELLITDPVGRVQQLRFFAPMTSQLLAPGLQQFSYSLGMPVSRENERRIYDWDNPLFTAAHRWGLSETLTSGGYLQASLNQQLLGIDGAWATPFGNVDWDMATSHDASLGLGYAGSLNYQYRRAGDTQNRLLNLGMEYRSPGFMSVGEDKANNNIALESRLSYSQKLFGSVRSNLGARYQWGRGDRGNAYRLNIGLSRPMGKGRTLGLSLSHQRRADDSAENQAKVNFSMSFSPLQGQRFRASTEVDLGGLEQQRLSWNYDPSLTFNRLRQNMGLSYSPEEWDLKQQLSWRSYRAEASLSNSMEGQTGSWLSPQEMSSELTFGSAIAFADGRWGFSRPINGSFAMLVAHPTLKGLDIEVNPGPRGAAAAIDRWGGAVLPGLSDYRFNTVNLDAPELPLGYSLGRYSHRLRPSYRRGTLIKVGQDSTVFLRGVLQDAIGEAISLQTGEVISLSDPDWSPLTLFTNRVGKFALEGLKPGRYIVRLTSGDEATFSIPPEATGLYQLDVIQFQSSQP